MRSRGEFCLAKLFWIKARSRIQNKGVPSRDEGIIAIFDTEKKLRLPSASVRLEGDVNHWRLSCIGSPPPSPKRKKKENQACYLSGLRRSEVKAGCTICSSSRRVCVRSRKRERSVGQDSFKPRGHGPHPPTAVWGLSVTKRAHSPS